MPRWFRFRNVRLLAVLLLCLWLWSTPEQEQQLERQDVKVSVVLPVHNGERYVSQALAALDAQTLRDIEVIIVDDGSTDSTPALVDKWASGRPWARVLHLKSNAGLPAALNVGHAVAKGQYITWVSADNVQYANFTQTLAAALDAHPECDQAFANHRVIDDHGAVRSDHVLRRPPRPASLVRGNPGLAAFMYRRQCFAAAGPYSEDLQGVEDWVLWGRMMAYCAPPVYVPTPLMGYRVHGDRLTERLADKRDAMDNVARRIIWQHMGRAVGLAARARETMLTWHENESDAARYVLVDTAQYLATHYAAHPQASERELVSDILTECMRMKPMALHTAWCAGNLAAFTGDSDAHQYALFVYDQLDASAWDYDAVQLGAKLTGPDRAWVNASLPGHYRRLRRLVDAAYTAHPSTARPHLVLVGRHPEGPHLPAMFATVQVRDSGTALVNCAREPCIVHVRGVDAIADVCARVPMPGVHVLADIDSADAVPEASRCGADAHFMAVSVDIAWDLDRAGVQQHRVFVKTESVSYVLVYRLVLAVPALEAADSTQAR